MAFAYLTDLPCMARAWISEVEQHRSGYRMPGKRQAGCRFLRAYRLSPYGPASAVHPCCRVREDK